MPEQAFLASAAQQIPEYSVISPYLMRGASAEAARRISWCCHNSRPFKKKCKLFTSRQQRLKQLFEHGHYGLLVLLIETD